MPLAVLFTQHCDLSLSSLFLFLLGSKLHLCKASWLLVTGGKSRGSMFVPPCSALCSVSISGKTRTKRKSNSDIFWQLHFHTFQYMYRIGIRSFWSKESCLIICHGARLLNQIWSWVMFNLMFLHFHPDWWLCALDNTDVFRIANTYKGHNIFSHFRYFQYSFIKLLQIKT